MSFYYNIKIPQQIMQEEKVKQAEQTKYHNEFDKQESINIAVQPLLSAYLANKDIKLITGAKIDFINHDKATIEDDSVKSLQEAYTKAERLNLPLLTAHSLNSDITEQITLDMLQKHFALYKKAAGISPRQRITSKLISQWGDLMNKSRNVLSQQNYFINNNTQRLNLFDLFWRYTPATKTLSANKLASNFLIPAANDWNALIITSNRYKKSLQEQGYWPNIN